MDRGPPPPGGDQDRGPEALVIQTTLTFLAFITVLFRFLARAIGDTAFGSDDWTMLLALVSLLKGSRLRDLTIHHRSWTYRYLLYQIGFLEL